MVNGTVLNSSKRYKDDLMVIFDQWPNLHLGLDALSSQKILKGVYCRRFAALVGNVYRSRKTSAAYVCLNSRIGWGEIIFLLQVLLQPIVLL